MVTGRVAGVLRPWREAEEKAKRAKEAKAASERQRNALISKGNEYARRETTDWDFATPSSTPGRKLRRSSFETCEPDMTDLEVEDLVDEVLDRWETTKTTRMKTKTRETGLSNLGNRRQNLGSNNRHNPGFNTGIESRNYRPDYAGIGRPESPAANTRHAVPTAVDASTAIEPSNALMAAPLTSLAHPSPRAPPVAGGVCGRRTAGRTRPSPKNGAAQAAQARETLLRGLLAAAQHYLNGEITVEEAAHLLGKHPETIRRAVRKGALPDGRTNPRGHLRIRRGDLQALAAPAPARYDPVADAQDIAQRRRPR